MIAVDGVTLTNQKAYINGRELSRIYINGVRAYTNGVAVPIDLKYDINGDGKVNSSDSQLVLQLIGKPASYNATTAKCDLDGNGKVEAADYLLITNYMKVMNTL